MKKVLILLAVFLCLILAAGLCGAEEMNEEENILGTWYYTSYENADDYPGTVFTADGAGQYFKVYTYGENLIVVDHTGYREITKEAVYEDGLLTV